MYQDEYEHVLHVTARLVIQFFVFVAVLYVARYVIDYVWSFLRYAFPHRT